MLARLGRQIAGSVSNVTAQSARSLASGRPKAPPMVYVKGEEMTRYTMELILDKWIGPHLDTSAWEFYDLSAKNRDSTGDKVLSDVIESGMHLKSIFKEPTITPTQEQVKEMGLSKGYGSPNGAMRRGWNGITISRDTIHIEGIELGYKNQVLFDRHAVGGEYGAGHAIINQGKLVTMYMPKEDYRDSTLIEPMVIDSRELEDELNAVAVYHNPLDNVNHLAHHFFSRCLQAEVVPYVVTKKTVFRWQEPFWQRLKLIFDQSYKHLFQSKGLLPTGELEHLLSDAATMRLIEWTQGGFGMVAHNYDGDILTDELAQMHKSPGFVTSVLTGKDGSGNTIKEFEASHGTCAEMERARLSGKETSLNPLGMVEGILGAMEHSATTHGSDADVSKFSSDVRRHMHSLFASNQGTRDLGGPTAHTTEGFIDAVAGLLNSGK